jgi:hypothetical protein
MTITLEIRFNEHQFTKIMSALTNLNSNITALTLAVAASIPDINPTPGTGATEAQVQAAADAVAAQTALLNAATSGVSPAGAPAAPVNLAASALGGGAVALSFGAPATPPSAIPTGYTVKRSTVSGAELSITPTPITATTFTDDGVPAGVTFYVVTALNSAGESLPSNEVSVAVI